MYWMSPQLTDSQPMHVHNVIWQQFLHVIRKDCEQVYHLACTQILVHYTTAVYQFLLQEIQ